MKTITFLLLCAVAGSIAPATATAADQAASTTATTEAACCNTTCVVCDKAVDPSVKTTSFKPSESVKTANPGIENAKIGFCSDACCASYEKDPAKFESKIVPHWQKSKNTPVKTK